MSGARGLRVLLVIGTLAAAPARAEAPADTVAVPPPAPPSGLLVHDVPEDAGRALALSWTASDDDLPGGTLVRGYYVDRAPSPSGPWTRVDSVRAGHTDYVDHTVRRGRYQYYRITAVGPGGATPAGSVTGPVEAVSNWFRSGRRSVLVLTVLFFAFVLFFIMRSQAGRKPFVRRLPGIDAIEEAIGRATEMGRPVLYVPGTQDIDEIQTMAGLSILESVARITAAYETRIVIPVTYPIPFAVAQEMVQSGCLHAGKPETYDRDSVRFVSPEQFAYVAAVTGIMMRDRPAANLFLGGFFAESLLLAETGYATGAIQVAGTANVHQLPFFVVACDYTLIGEELYAASAYLSGQPRLLGSLAGSDWMKVVVIALIVIGCALETMGVGGLTHWMATR